MNQYDNPINFVAANPVAKKNTLNGVNNNNFNKSNYIQQSKPNDLCDAYSGFIRGNMFPDLYNQYKISRPFDIQPMNEQAQLLTYVDAYTFGKIDLNLYLDTHPNDRAMIELFNQYRVECENAVKEYEKRFGPLTIDSEATLAYPWSWNQSPWPWENK